MNLTEMINKIKTRAISADENTKIIVSNTSLAFLVKGGALVISLLTMPAFMRYFEDQRVLGVWFTILSVITWILNFDLGIGNGLRNHLVESLTVKNYENARRYISSGYILIGLLVLVISTTGFIVAPFISWNSVFNVSTDIISANVMLQVTRCVFIGIMLQFFLRLISSILYALQKSAINNIISLLTSVMQLTFVLLAPSISPEKNLIMLSLAYIFFANIPLLIVTIWVFISKMKGFFPRVKYFSKTHAKAVLSLGGLFFFCQILYMVLANTNEFFITQYTSPSDVVQYQVYNKLFGLAGMLFMLALTPIWSLVTKAINEKNYAWLDTMYKKMKKIGLLACLAQFLIIPFLPFLLKMWLGKNTIEVNYLCAISFAIFGCVFIYQSIVSTVACGVGKLKIQLTCYCTGVIAKFIIIHFAMQVYNSWIVVVITNIIILLPYCIIQNYWLKNYIIEGKRKIKT